MSVQTALPVSSAAEISPRISPHAEKLEHLVFDRTEGMLRNLRITIHADEVVLTGSAPSYYAKQLATHAVFDAMPGVNLSNLIRVC